MCLDFSLWWMIWIMTYLRAVYKKLISSIKIDTYYYLKLDIMKYLVQLYKIKLSDDSIIK